MHPRQSTILSACLGFTATFGARVWLPSDEVRPSVRPLVVTRTAQSPQAPEAVDACPAAAETLREKRDGLSGELSRLRLEQEMVRIQTGTALGFPQTWEGRLPFEAPDAYRARLEAALAEHDGMELLAIDCEEYPCLPLLAGTARQEIRYAVDAPYAELDDPTCASFWSHLGLRKDGQPRSAWVMVVHSRSGLSDDFHKRLGTRLERLREEWQVAYGEVVR